MVEGLSYPYDIRGGGDFFYFAFEKILLASVLKFVSFKSLSFQPQVS